MTKFDAPEKIWLLENNANFGPNYDVNLHKWENKNATEYTRSDLVSTSCSSHESKPYLEYSIDPNSTDRRMRLPWSPIEHAPKDGTPLLISDKEFGVVVGKWSQGHNPCWENTVNLLELTHPTHFMLLPDLPTEGE